MKIRSFNPKMGTYVVNTTCHNFDGKNGYNLDEIAQEVLFTETCVDYALHTYAMLALAFEDAFKIQDQLELSISPNGPSFYATKPSVMVADEMFEAFNSWPEEKFHAHPLVPASEVYFHPIGRSTPWMSIRSYDEKIFRNLCERFDCAHILEKSSLDEYRNGIQGFNHSDHPNVTAQVKPFEDISIADIENECARLKEYLKNPDPKCLKNYRDTRSLYIAHAFILRSDGSDQIKKICKLCAMDHLCSDNHLMTDIAVNSIDLKNSMIFNDLIEALSQKIEPLLSWG